MNKTELGSKTAKGGTPNPTKLQFKIKPCQLFNLEK